MINTKVMIIEDDIAIAELHRKYLSQIDGFEVIGIATSKQEVELQLTALDPELILLDVYLPDGNGLDILRTLRLEQKQCDVILITAARDVTTLQEAMRGGVVDYLLKPVIFGRLKEALGNYHQKKRELQLTDNIDQSMVDKMLKPTATIQAGEQRLPKGIDKVTLEKIRYLIQTLTRITAEEAGEQIGASRTTARRYLEFLISTGEVEADVNYGSVGRPERSYLLLKR